MPGQQRALSGICGALGMGEHHPGDGGASLWGLGSIAWGGGTTGQGDGPTDTLPRGWSSIAAEGCIAPGMGDHCPGDTVPNPC